MFYFYATAINKLANLCHHIPRLAKIFCNFTTFLLLLKLTKKALNMTQNNRRLASLRLLLSVQQIGICQYLLP